ncbi:hypothetical protein NDU88_005473 [Pleurodeles waltl]|uniref:Uncharacterized protein n=1 Tax=Pleurodeles waltl TaxID=8319 RepID=A0AAV7TBH1_PLEWA|nr:hypothetical protein NDU88_005473 [Pleurodeles waltl]
MGFAYSLLFPARLWVVAADTMHLFVTPEEAWHWLESPGARAARLTRTVSTKNDHIQWNQRGNEDMWGGDLPVVPNLDQRLQERRRALERAAALPCDVALNRMLRTPHLSMEKALLPPGHLCTARLLLQK